MRLIAWVHQIHAAGGGKWLHHGDGVLCCLLSKKGERKKSCLCCVGSRIYRLIQGLNCHKVVHPRVHHTAQEADYGVMWCTRGRAKITEFVTLLKIVP